MKTPKRRTKSDDLARFVGLDQAQVAKLIEIEGEHVLHAHFGTDTISYRSGREKLKKIFGEAGLELTDGMLRYYATHFEAKAHVVSAEFFYLFLWKRTPEYTDLRSFYVRHQDIDKLLEKFDASDDEILGIVTTWMKQGFKEKSPQLLARCLPWLSKFEMYEQIGEICAWAIGQGETSLAHDAARAGGRWLTSDDYYILGRKLIQSNNREVLDFLLRHNLGCLGPELLEMLVRETSCSWHNLMNVADRTGCYLSPGLIRTFLKTRRRDIDYKDRVLACEALVRKVPSVNSKKCLREEYRQARMTALGFGEVKQAEEFGQRIGSPLLPHELQSYLDEYGSDVRQCVIDQNVYARTLLAQRICARLKSPPPRRRQAAA